MIIWEVSGGNRYASNGGMATVLILFAVATVTGLAISLLTLSITAQRTAYNKMTSRITHRTQVCTYVLYSPIIKFVGGKFLTCSRKH